MSEIKNVFINTSWITISQIISGFFAFIWNILIARYLGVNDFGILSFGTSFTYITSIITDFGLNTYAIRDMSRDTHIIKRYIGNIIPLKIILSAITFLISLIILKIMGFNTITISVTLIMVIQTIVINLSSLLNGGFQAIGKLKYPAIGTIIYSFTQMILILVGVYLKLDLIFITFSYVFGYVIMFIYLYYHLNQNIGTPKFNIDISFWKKSLKIALPFVLTMLFTNIYYSMDSVMLTYFVNDIATGLYNSSYKIIGVLTTFFSVYQSIMFPLMSKFFKSSEDLLKISFVKSIKYILLIILPLILGMIIYAKPITVLIYGSAYTQSFSVLQILVLSVIFLFVNGAITTLLNASNKEKTVTLIYCIGVIFNCCLNLLLINIYSYNGAAIATVVSEIFICIIMSYVLTKTKYSPDISIFKDIIKIIVGGMIMMSIISFIDNLWIGIVVGGVVYLIAVLLLKVLDDDDKYLIREIIKK